VFLTGPVRAVDLFNTGFESNQYALGTLTGQNGWIAFRDANVTAAQVSAAAAHTGAQGVKLDGALMELYPIGLYRGYYFPPINYDTTGTGNTVIEYSCDAALFIAPTDQTFDVAWQTQFYSAAGLAYGGIGMEWYGDGTSAAYAFNFSGSIEATTLNLATWTHLVAQLDLAAGTLTLIVDGVPVPSVPLDIVDPVFGDADLTLICDQPFASYAHVDNYRIVARGPNPCPCPGDFTGDQAVGLPDLTLVLSSFGGPPSDPCMDFNPDGVISIHDLTQFLSLYGQPCP
jgi:hypothetical protein